MRPSVALPNGPHAHSNGRTYLPSPSVRRWKRCLADRQRFHGRTATLECLEEPVYLTAASVSPEGVRLYWSTTFADCSGDTRQLWNKINRVIKPPTASQITYSVNDLADHFVGKVDKIRANIASARPSCVTDRLSTALSMFQLVTAEDVHRLITRAPCKALRPRPGADLACETYYRHILAPLLLPSATHLCRLASYTAHRSKLE